MGRVTTSSHSSKGYFQIFKEVFLYLYSELETSLTVRLIICQSKKQKHLSMSPLRLLLLTKTHGSNKAKPPPLLPSQPLRANSCTRAVWQAHSAQRPRLKNHTVRGRCPTSQISKTNCSPCR